MNRSRVLSLVMVVVLLITLIPSAQYNVSAEGPVVTANTLNYRNLGNAQESLVLSGDAVTVNNGIRFENGSGLDGGSVYTRDKLTLNDIDDGMSFTTSFAFSESFTPNTIGDGGFSFVIQSTNDPLVTSPSLSVFINSSYFLLKDNGHTVSYSVAVARDGDYENLVYEHTTMDFNVDNSIKDGTPVRADIVYDDGLKELKVTLVSTDIFNEEVKAFVIPDIDLDQILNSNSDVYVGFSGGIGDAEEICTINDWFFENSINFSNEFLSSNYLLIEDDINWLFTEGEAIILNGNSSFETLTNDLYLPTKLPNGTSIVWDSLNELLLENDGTLNRPAGGAETHFVNLSYYVLDVFGNVYLEAAYEANIVRLESKDEYVDNRPLSVSSANPVDFQGNGATAVYDSNGAKIDLVSVDGTLGETLGGSVYVKDKIHLGDDLSFSTAFSFTERYGVGATGFGGFAFSIQNDSNTIYGDQANSLGAPIITPSISFGIETVYVRVASTTNQGFNYHREYNFIVFKNGDYNNPLYSENMNSMVIYSAISSGQKVKCTIDYDGTSHNLKFGLVSSDPAVIDYAYRFEASDLDLGGIFTLDGNEPVQDVYVGFTGATGDVQETCQITDFYFSNNMATIDLDKYDYTIANDISVMSSNIDYTTGSSITVVVSDSIIENNPSPFVEVMLESSLGEVFPSKLVTNSLGEATFLIISDEDGSASITATADGGAYKSLNVEVSSLDKLGLIDQDRVDYDSKWLTESLILNGNDSFDHIIGDLSLPQTGAFGSLIAWSISDMASLSTYGTINRPSINENDAIVTLTAVVSHGGSEITKEFIVTIKATQTSDLEKVNDDYERLTEAIVINKNVSKDYITSSVNLPEYGVNGSTISWSSSSWRIDTDTSVVYRMEGYHWGDEDVQLTATISKGDISVQKTFVLTVKNYPPTDNDSVVEDINWISSYDYFSSSDNELEVTENLDLPAYGIHGSLIRWESSDTSLVDTDGTVNRPLEGDAYQDVTLTATVSRGDFSETNIVNIRIVSLLLSDEERIAFDMNWMDIRNLIKDNNSSNALVNMLNMTTAGKYGSSISWESSNESVVSTDGTIYRNDYILGDEEVTLTATFSYGGLNSNEKEFVVVVKSLAGTELEIVNKASSLLTEALVINANASSDHIVTNVVLPMESIDATVIRWTSSNESIISLAGNVNRPLFGEGDSDVELIATIVNGSTEIKKTYMMIVKETEGTDLEVINVVSSLIDEELIINLNSEANYITSNLHLPSSSDYGSTISWSSSNETIVSTEGIVNRPEIGDSDKSILLAALISKGNESEQKSFNLVVKSIEADYVKLLETSPIDGQKDITYTSNQIILTFDKEVELPANEDAVHVGYYDDGNFIEVDKSLRTENKTLIINLSEDLVFDAEYSVAIAKEMIFDRFGRPLLNDVYVSFIVESKSNDEITVVSSIPDNGEKDVLSIRDIDINFNYFNIEMGDAFNGIKLVASSTSEEVSISKSLSGSHLSIVIDDNEVIKEAEIYEVTLPYGAITDRFKNQSEATTIVFKTRNDLIAPSVNHVYPLDGQVDVDVHQTIEVAFSKKVIRDKTWMVRLVDDLGNIVATEYKYEFVEDRYSSPGYYYNYVRKLYLKPIEKLDSGTTYHVTVGEESFRDSYYNYLEPTEISFITGTNELELVNVNISDNSINVGVNTDLIIGFSSDVVKGDHYDDMKIVDSNNNRVYFESIITGNKVVISPDEYLDASECYTVTIPNGAFKDKLSAESNNSYKMSFKTSRPLIDYYYNQSFNVQPRVDNIYTGMSVSLNAEKFIPPYYAKFDKYSWDYGDNTTGSGRAVTHSYVTEGDYEVTLIIEDNQGSKAVFKKTISVIDELSINPSDVSIRVKEDRYIQGYGKRLLEVYEYRLWSTDKISDDTKVIIADVTYNGLPLPKGHRVYANLYKDGELVDYLGYNVTTEKGRIFIEFNYHYFEGDYELVLSYGDADSGSKASIPLSVHVGGSKTVNITLAVENGDTELPNSIELEVNGHTRTVYRLGYTYELRVVNGEYEIKLSDSDEVFFPTGSKKILNIEKDMDVLITVKRKPSGLPVIGSVTGDYFTRTLFIEGIERSINIEVSGDWNHHPIGYVELRTGDKIIRKNDLKFTIDVGSFGIAGEEIYARMISEDGTASSWYNTRIEVAPAPPKTSLNELSFEDGAYNLKMKSIISGYTEGKIGSLDKMPLLDTSESFGFNGMTNILTGRLRGGTITYNLDLSHRNEAEVQSIGSTLEGAVSASVRYDYDYDENIWKFTNGYVAMIVSRSTKVKEKVVLGKIKGIEIGPDVITIITHKIGGQFNAEVDEKGNEDYSGVLYYSLGIDYGIDASIAGFGIEGWGGGKIATQLHIPTWYVQVDPSLYVKVLAKSYLGESVIYYEEARTTWNNGREKVPSVFGNTARKSLADIIDDVSLKPMSRDYLDYPKSMGSEGALSGQVKENIYPYAEVNMASSENDLWMVWTDDNPERSAMNRAQLMYSVNENGIWTEPSFIDQDGTNDFNPTVASTGNGVLIAWEDINKQLPETVDMETLDAFTANSEISVTNGVYSLGNNQVTLSTITDDDKNDHSPVIAANNSNALLAWVKSDDVSDRLMYAKWNGNQWSEAELVYDTSLKVVDLSLSFDNNKGIMLYTVDTDQDTDTLNDQEIYKIEYDGNTWGEASRMTTNELSDQSPKAVYINGEWFISWLQEGYIVYKNGQEDVKKTGFLTNVNGSYDLETKGNQVALVFKSLSENNQRELSMILYDIVEEQWSDVITVAETNDYIRSFDGVFTSDGELSIAYSQAKMMTEIVNEREYNSPSNHVDLMTNSYSFKHDLSINGSITLSNENPISGSKVTIGATIANKGDYAEYAKVVFYNGNPDSNGVKIGEVITVNPVLPSDYLDVEMLWIADGTDYELYVVVESDLDVNVDNNTGIHRIIREDISLEQVSAMNFSKDDYLVSFYIVNRGSKVLDDISVEVINDGVIKAIAIDSLNVLQGTTVEFVLSSRDLGKDMAGDTYITLSAKVSGISEEFTLSNNNVKVELEERKIEITSSNVIQNAIMVDINQSLVIQFNMPLDEGNEFDGIALQDNFLNTIEVTAILEGDVLTITPTSPLEYNASYKLIVPEDAVNDSYGHVLNKTYTHNFTTESSNPEIVLSYPGDDLENQRIDTDIKFLFNQEMLQGLKYDDIELNDLNDNAVKISKVIEGEWLHIYPSSNLDYNTDYVISIPSGAITNNRSESNHKYMLAFKTVDTVAGNSDRINDKVVIQEVTALADIGNAGVIAIDGKEVVNVVIDSNKLKEIMKYNKVITIESGGSSVQVDFTLDDVKNLKDNAITFIIKSGDVSYELNTAYIEIDKILNEFGSDIDINDIVFSTRIKETSEDMLKIVEEVARENGLSIVLPPVDFEIEVVYQNQKIVIDTFSGYIKRIIELPDDADITTAVIIDEVGNIRQVPTLVKIVNNQRYAVINSMTNSTYAIIKNKVNYEDIEGMWSEGYITEMGERFIYDNGIAFNPKEIVTRAEMVKTVVKALGLKPKDNDIFIDVPIASDYNRYVGTAYAYNITNGTGINTFSPDSEVTREQVMVFIYNMAKAINLEYPNEMVDLSNYTDYHEASDYAKEAIMWNVANGIIIGTSNTTLSPKDYLTKEQGATILYNFLVSAGLIDN